MMTHLLRVTAAIAAITLCTVLPFLPGRYDSLAAPLSMMAQLFGKVGLLLVPVGAAWIASERWSRLARMRHVFAVTAVIASAVVWGIVSLGAFVESLALGLAAFAVGAYVVLRFLRRLRRGTGVTPRSASMLPLYFVIVPVAVAALQLALADPVVEFSRDRAIRNSAALIADIEQYRIANGRYPPSLVAVNKDYLPRVIGIKEYRYEPRGNAYNILFEQITFSLGTIEIVMYNPRDEQVMTSHAMDVLQLTPEQLAVDQTRGHNAVHDARQPHWKYFWFD
jgi:hypothetical protein